MRSQRRQHNLKPEKYKEDVTHRIVRIAVHRAAENERSAAYEMTVGDIQELTDNILQGLNEQGAVILIKGKDNQ
jgi:hypothetical protein